MDSPQPHRRLPEVAPAQDRTELSDREREILILVASGATNKQIAQQLVISPNTVKVHVRNIFAKIGTGSRTEAAMFAVREGLVKMPGSALEADGNRSSVGDSAPLSAPALPVANPAARVLTNPALWLAGVLALTVLILALTNLNQRTQPPAASPDAPVTLAPRWQSMTSMLEARSGLAAATYDNQIFAIGGESVAGVTGTTERFDPVTNQWALLAPKPMAVADIGAVVIGGLIYVPGGRQASGLVTDAVEVYDPRNNQWSARAAMPMALAGYASAAFEGRLYVFGGWDGQQPVDTVLEYDPSRDRWTTRQPMPEARAYAGAAAAGGKIYVIGGTGTLGALSVNAEFDPDANAAGGQAWHAREPMPAPRSGLAVVSLADIIHVVGGEGAAADALAIEYLPHLDAWQAMEPPQIQEWSQVGLAAVGTHIYAFGGMAGEAHVSEHLAYQALYTISFPIVK